MPDYSKAKIYKLSGGGDIYIGHTTTPLNIRFNKHKTERLNSCLSILDSPDCKIELIEEYPCDTFEEIVEREQYWLNLYPNTKNRQSAKGLGKLEYNRRFRKANPLKCKQYCDKYRKANQPAVSEKHRIWREKVGWNEIVNKRGREKRLYLGWLKDFNF